MVSHTNPQRAARRAVIGGRVQGVWFRDFVRRRAQSLGVAGWARNRPDGTVEVLAEGEPDAVGALLDYCQDGPPRAVVESVAVDEITPAGLSGFAVR